MARSSRGQGSSAKAGRKGQSMTADSTDSSAAVARAKEKQLEVVLERFDPVRVLLASTKRSVTPEEAEEIRRRADLAQRGALGLK